MDESLRTALEWALGSLPEESIRQEYEPGSTHEGGPTLYVEWDALLHALAASPADPLRGEGPLIEAARAFVGEFFEVHEYQHGTWDGVAERGRVLEAMLDGLANPPLAAAHSEARPDDVRREGLDADRRRIIELVAARWAEVPMQRLGQMLMNHARDRTGFLDLWDITDDEWSDRLAASTPETPEHREGAAES